MSKAKSFDKIEESLQLLLEGLKPATRKKALSEVAKHMRQSNRKRIQNQQNGDGAKYKKRKKNDLHGQKTISFDYSRGRQGHFKIKPTAEKKGYVRGYFPWYDKDDPSAWATFSRSKMKNIMRSSNLTSRKKMLIGFKRHIKPKATPDKAETGIYGNASKLAKVHDEGKTENGVNYPSRELIEFESNDVQAIRNILQKYILAQAFQ